MIWGRQGTGGLRRGGRSCLMPLFTLLLGSVLVAPVSAQMFSDRPPPVPPASVPDVLAGPAMNLAPSSGPASGPSLPPPLTAPPAVAAVPPVVAPQGAVIPNQGVLALTARFGKDLPAVTGGLVWRVFSDRPDETGNMKMVREDRSATPNIVLPPGNYVIDVALGLVS